MSPIDSVATLPSVSAADRAYEALRDSIIEGRYPAGTMLGEVSIAASLEVSRTPVRAALLRLQNEGWVVIYPKRCALVQGLSERAKVDLADARFVLEATSVQRASREALDRLVAELQRSIERQRVALTAGDTRNYIDLTIEFHRHFVEVGGNEVLLELNDRLSDRQRYILFAVSDWIYAERDKMLAEHEQLVSLVQAGDIPGFGRALRDHVSHTYSAPIPPARLPYLSSMDQLPTDSPWA